MTESEYRFTIRPLAEGEGTGYLIEYPDLPGCMSDGETIEEAIANGADAKQAWLTTVIEDGLPVPPPTHPDAAYSGKWQIRVPRSLHRHLAERAELEGVSLNALATAFLAEGLGRKNAA